MADSIALIAGQTSRVVNTGGRGTKVTLTVPAGSYAVVQHTNADAAAIANNTAVWFNWPKGFIGGTSIAQTVSDVLNYAQYVRCQCVTGPVTFQVSDSDPANLAQVGARWLSQASGLLVLGNLAQPVGHIPASATSGTYSQSGTTITVTVTAHGITSGQIGRAMYLTMGGGNAPSGFYVVASVPDVNTITYTSPASMTTSGTITLDSVAVERRLIDVPVYGGSMGLNSCLRLWWRLSGTNSVNSKNLRLGMSATQFFTSGSIASNAMFTGISQIRNKNSLTAQVGTVITPTFGVSTTAPSNFTIDTKVDQTVYLSVVNATANEAVQVEDYTLELVL